MTRQRVSIAASVARSADLTARAGLPVRLRDGWLSVAADVPVEEDLVRHLGELDAVAAEPVGRRARRREYRMLNGVRRAGDTHLESLPLRYELTGMVGRPIGWEAAKTAGHVHVRPPGARLGYAEIVEVLHGEAGFLVADLVMTPEGPRSTRAWLVRARPGDWVVLPPVLAHVTIDLGAGPLVFSDVIDRRATGIYAGVREARGFGWYVGADGELRPNDRYASPPRLQEVSAADWSGPAPGPLYEAFRDDPGHFAWLSDADGFRAAASALAARLGDVLTVAG
jgi:glucose-6-phosphate isomerase